MGHVYYHHPGDKQFSLDFVHPDPAEVVSHIVNYDDDVVVKVQKHEIDEAFYVVYTSRVDGGSVREIDFDLKASLAKMSEDNSTIVVRLFEIYRALIAQNEKEEGVPVEAYKQIDVDALPGVLDRTSWEGSATAVAGRLASNLILKHTLPNANHRMAVALIQFYLRRLNPAFSMPETSIEIDPESYDWREWVNEYINESKRLLTVRRKNVLFKHLYRFGARTLERKHAVEIDLTAYELDMYPSEAKVVYAEQHEELWTEFVEEAVERAGYPELKETPGLSKAEFAEKIRNLD
ncbi:uncharacterized protein HfgLR_21475 (plasmid) [Haloferax gibbonsii]|uniref:Uncharacterized protein n=1 Tax=Haloferax gibbonsii TaxID=35746 RepID=A0A871BKE2_HALGI|nr:hypothetical protein [Haloferax gibbonsii]QOS13518.1 uncharacterized protein HfgLR_21475 [Haloferax gibbonsii]